MGSPSSESTPGDRRDPHVPGGPQQCDAGAPGRPGLPGAAGPAAGDGRSWRRDDGPDGSKVPDGAFRSGPAETGADEPAERAGAACVADQPLPRSDRPSRPWPAGAQARGADLPGPHAPGTASAIPGTTPASAPPAPESVPRAAEPAAAGLTAPTSASASAWEPGLAAGPAPQAGGGSEGGGEGGDGGPWPEGGAALLVELLLRVEPLARSSARFDLLDHMDRVGGPYPLGAGGYAVGVPEAADARGHIRALVRAVERRADPARGLHALCGGVRELAPYDRSLAWLELAALGLSGAAPLEASLVVRIVRALHPVGDLPPALAPAPAQLARHVPRGVPGTGLVTGTETLPEILLRLSDLRGAPDPGPLLRFLAGLAGDRELAAYGRLAPLRDLLAALEADHPGAAAPGAPPAGTLIVQIRVEALDPEHVGDARYELRGAYYRRPPDGGPMVRLGSLPPSGPLRLSELADAGSRRLTAWAGLAREVRGAAASGGVRVEFLLPKPLLGHRAELWSAGASRTPLGHHHPVVVRSLERYSDPWLDPEPWRRRWRRLCEDGSGYRREGGAPGAGPYGGGPRGAGPGDVRPAGAAPPEPSDPLARIAWPPLADLRTWLQEQPDSACLGLAQPYDDLAAAVREALHDALFMEGVPVLVWRRDRGDPGDIVTALRPYAPARLRDLPQSVHMCRKHARAAGAQDVRNNITLLWDDPECVDEDQDLPFAGMA